MSKIIVNSKLFIAFGLLVTFLQLLFDTLNVAGLGKDSTVYIGAIGMLLAIVHSGVEQYLSKEIDDKTLYIQLALFFAFVGGGVLDKLDYLPLNDEAKSIIRVVLTMLTNFIPIVLKTINSLPNKDDV